MKKILAITAVLFAAAACNQQAVKNQSNNQTQNPAAAPATEQPVTKTHYANSTLGISLDIPSDMQTKTNTNNPKITGVDFSGPEGTGTISVQAFTGSLDTFMTGLQKTKAVKNIQQTKVDGMTAVSFVQSNPVSTNTAGQNIPTVAVLTGSKLYFINGILTNTDILASVKFQ